MFVQDRSAMIHLFNPFLKIKLRLGRAMVVAATISCLSLPVAMAKIIRLAAFGSQRMIARPVLKEAPVLLSKCSVLNLFWMGRFRRS